MDYSEIQQLDPETIKNLMELGVIPGQLEQTQADILRGQQMQDTPAPGGRTFRNGIYQAANPLEHLATALRRFRGRDSEAEARSQADILREEQTQGRQKFLDAYFRRNMNTGINPNAAPSGLSMMLRRGPHLGGY